MKALISLKDEVIAIADDFEVTKGQVAVLTRGVIEYYFGNLNSNNVSVFDYATVQNVPTDLNITRKYLLSDETFIANPDYVSPPVVTLNGVAATLAVPNAGDETSVSIKSQAIINNWLNLDAEGLVTLPADLKEGLALIGLDPSTLTPDQVVCQKLAVNWKFKLNARFAIEAKVGDVYDLIADQAKRLSMMNRLLLRLSNQVLCGVPMEDPYKTEYSQLVQMYLAGVDAGTIYDRGDLEDDLTMFLTLTVRDKTMADIVKTDYFDKKV
jgi:hypothetical protein